MLIFGGAGIAVVPWASNPERGIRLSRSAPILWYTYGMPFKDKGRANAYSVERCRRRRQAWLLANGPCWKCGSWDELEVDHVDPSLKESHRIWSWGPDKIKAELAKCQPLCHKCHAEKTAQSRRNAPTVHGCSHGYDRGCRCGPCRQWQIDRMVAYHADHPRSKKRLLGSSSD